MKKLLLNFWKFLNSIFLQLLLSVVAFISWNMAIELGTETFHANGSFKKNFDMMATDVDVTAGFDGGALAMGLITCMCVFGVVWLQINKTKP